MAETDQKSRVGVNKSKCVINVANGSYLPGRVISFAVLTNIVLKRISLQIFYAVLIAGLFSACSPGNKFASSFGKRKYIKGYYMDMPSSIATIAANNAKKQRECIVNSVSQNPIPNNNVVVLQHQIIKSPLRVLDKTFKCGQNPGNHIYEAVVDTPVTSHKIKYVYINGGWYASENNEIKASYSFVALILTIVAYLLSALYFINLIGSGLAGVAISSGFMALPYIALVLDIGAVVFSIITLIKKDEGNKGLAIVVLVCNILLLVFLLILRFV